MPIFVGAMETAVRFVDVILPLPLPRYFTYSLAVDQTSAVQVGSRMIVPFGKRKFYTAIAVSIHNNAPEEYEAKEVVAVLDNAPVVHPDQIKFWEWIAEYYLCTVGEVYKAALPSGLKIESETQLMLNGDAEIDAALLTEKELLVIDKLPADEKISVLDLVKETGLKNILPVVRSLLEKEYLIISEELRDAFRPKLEQYVRLTLRPDDQDRLRNLFDELAKAPKQQALLLRYLDLSQFLLPGSEPREVTRKRLLESEGISAAVLKSLIDKGIFENYTKEKTRLSTYWQTTVATYPLTDAQQVAFDAIRQQFTEKNTVLLHGVTSCGKTELYIHLIQEQLSQGKQVLYLLPEIALTTQLTDRLQRVFGNKLGIYHSKFSDNERVEIWNNLLKDKSYDIILGVRSSVFLPFRNLGLVIVDEEHESTYKQQDPAPRYHARNAALVLASMHGAKTLLGTATPAIETYHLALEGKFGLVELFTRFEGLQLPRILPVDTKELRRKKQMNGTFSPQLIEKMKMALSKKEQIILFQNRRGFAPMLECRQCAWVPKCKNCDVSLTYHKATYQITCHYCGYSQPIPRSCAACGGTSLDMRGVGTERIEDDIKALFPDVSVARMDLDTTRSRKSHEVLIRDFEDQKTKILIGTQMVSKGLDFDNVSIVGILSADTMMNFPDFRAHERAFQLMVQVSGRAGRKNKQGEVVLQCSDTAHPVIRQIVASDYRALYETQLQERQLFRYPPYFRLIYIYLKHRNEPLLDQMAQVMAGKLRAIFGERILGPDKPPVARVQTFYIKKIVLKIENHAALSRVKELLRQAQKEILETEGFKSALVYYDVDPM